MQVQVRSLDPEEQGGRLFAADNDDLGRNIHFGWGKGGGEHQASSVYFFYRIILETDVEAGKPYYLSRTFHSNSDIKGLS